MAARRDKQPSRWGLWVAAGIVFTAVLAAIIGMLLPTGAPDSAPVPGRTELNAPTAPTKSGAACDRSSTSTDPPADLRWAASRGLTWPVSDSTGPTRVDDGFPVCFEQSPIGAALAATTILFSGVDRDRGEVAEFYTAESPGKDAYVDNVREGVAEGVDIADSLTSAGVTVAGYRVDEYTDEHATILLVIRIPQSATGYMGLPIRLVWEGDWRYQVDDLGNEETVVPVNGGQFTTWRPDA